MNNLQVQPTTSFYHDQENDLYVNIISNVSNNENTINIQQADSQSIGDKTIDENRISEKVLQSKEKTVLEIQRGYASHSFCFICRRKTGSKPMSVLSIEATIDIYMKRNILIPRGARTCSGHLTENNYIKEEDIEKYR